MSTVQTGKIRRAPPSKPTNLFAVNTAKQHVTLLDTASGSTLPGHAAPTMKHADLNMPVGDAALDIQPIDPVISKTPHTSVGAQTPIMPLQTQPQPPNPSLPPQSPNLPTPVQVSRLKHYLRSYDPKKTKYLIDGFSQGFTLGHSGPIQHLAEVRNSHSTSINQAAVSKKLQDEVRAE